MQAPSYHNHSIMFRLSQWLSAALASFIAGGDHVRVETDPRPEDFSEVKRSWSRFTGEGWSVARDIKSLPTGDSLSFTG